MCHACLLGDRKYIHELPDSTSLDVKTDDLINGRYNWDPEYFYVANNPKQFSGFIISEEEIKETEMYGHIHGIVNETFPHKLI